MGVSLAVNSAELTNLALRKILNSLTSPTLRFSVTVPPRPSLTMVASERSTSSIGASR